MNFRFTGHSLTLAAIVLLLLWLSLWLGLLASAGIQQRIAWLLLALLPLLIVGYFVLRDMKGGFAWCGFISLGYFAQGVTVTLTSRENALAGTVEIFLSLLLFTSAGITLRAYRRAR